MMLRCMWLVLLLLSPTAAVAAADLAQFAYHPKLGAQLSLDAVFHDEAGRPVHLGDLFDARPVILALGYFRCPNLCGIVRADLMDALARSGLQAQHDYTLILISIDPAETATDAATAKHADTARDSSAAGWHYLTGTAGELADVAQKVGFRTRFDPALKQFLHPAGLVFLTPRGTVSSYLLGVGYEPGDITRAVARARQGAIASAAQPVLLLCFHYDPATGRYTLAITRILQLAGVLTVLTLGGTIALSLRRERRR